MPSSAKSPSSLGVEAGSTAARLAALHTWVYPAFVASVIRFLPSLRSPGSAWQPLTPAGKNSSSPPPSNTSTSAANIWLAISVIMFRSGT